MAKDVLQTYTLFTPAYFGNRSSSSSLLVTCIDILMYVVGKILEAIQTFNLFKRINCYELRICGAKYDKLKFMGVDH